MCIYVRCALQYNELTKCFKCDFRAIDYNINSQLTEFSKEKGNNVKKNPYENVFLRTSASSSYFE